MKVLAILRPPPGANVTREIAQRAHEELTAVWDLYTDGFVREMYSPGGPGAVLVLEADSGEAAAQRLAVLPLLASETMRLETIELHPFAALAMLF